MKTIPFVLLTKKLHVDPRYINDPIQSYVGINGHLEQAMNGRMLNDNDSFIVR